MKGIKLGWRRRKGEIEKAISYAGMKVKITNQKIDNFKTEQEYVDKTKGTRIKNAWNP